MDNLAVIPNGSLIVGKDGRIAALGPYQDIDTLITNHNYTFDHIHDLHGIGFTVDCVRKASPNRLLSLLLQRLRRMSRSGTTLLEAKSGYGLDAANEGKMLQVIDAANDAFSAIDLVGNFCG